MNDLTLALIKQILIYFSIFALASVAGMFSERSGIVNIGIDGFMVMGATGFAITTSKLGDGSAMTQVIAMLVGIIVAALFSMLHSYATIVLKCDHIVSGIAINLLGEALGLFICTIKTFTGGGSFIDPKVINALYLDKNMRISFYLFISIIVTAIVGIYLSFTKPGKRHVAAGENPQALDVVGVSVNKYRFIAVTISGAIAGLAGVIFVAQKSFTRFDGSVNGYGYIGLAIMVAGQWRVTYCLGFSALFSIFFGCGEYMPNLKVFHDVKNATPLFSAIPFIVSLAAMVCVSKKSRPPKAAGQAFIKTRK